MQAGHDGEAVSEWEAAREGRLPWVVLRTARMGWGVKAVTTVQITQLGGAAVRRKMLFSFGMKGELVDSNLHIFHSISVLVDSFSSNRKSLFQGLALMSWRQQGSEMSLSVVEGSGWCDGSAGEAEGMLHQVRCFTEDRSGSGITESSMCSSGHWVWRQGGTAPAHSTSLVSLTNSV